MNNNCFNEGANYSINPESRVLVQILPSQPTSFESPDITYLNGSQFTHLYIKGLTRSPVRCLTLLTFQNPMTRRSLRSFLF